MLGIPGTLFNAIKRTSEGYLNFIYQIYNEGHEILNEIATRISGIISIDDNHIKPYFNNLKAINEISTQNMQSLETMIKQYSSISHKFSKYTLEISTSKSKSALKQYRKKFLDVMAARKKIEPFRLSLIEKFQEQVDDANKNYQMIAVGLNEHNTKIKDFLLWYAKQIDDFSSKMQEYAAAMHEVADNIDFADDFKAFINYNKIVRYDMEDIEFVPFDTNHPAFKDVEIISIDHGISEPLPVGIAKVVHDYEPRSINEMRCQAGKYVLLMESLNEADDDNDGWCYSMNPFTRKSGFLPIYCLQTVGINFGVILRDPDNPSIPANKGSFISVLQNENSLNYIVQNISGEQFTIPKSSVGILF